MLHVMLIRLALHIFHAAMARTMTVRLLVSGLRNTSLEKRYFMCKAVERKQIFT